MQYALAIRLMQLVLACGCVTRTLVSFLLFMSCHAQHFSARLAQRQRVVGLEGAFGRLPGNLTRFHALPRGGQHLPLLKEGSNQLVEKLVVMAAISRGDGLLVGELGAGRGSVG